MNHPHQIILTNKFHLANDYSEMDYDKAIFWFSKLSELDYPIANLALGKIYNSRNGVEINHVKAATYFRKAANQNISDAQYELGMLYFHGQGLDKDIPEAINWLEK